MSVGASVALIFLIIQTMFATLIILVLFAAMVFGMHKLRQLMVRFMPKAQAFTQKVADVTHLVSDKIAAPFLRINGITANVQGTARGAKRRVTR
jgi:Sec-independent protein translocase protein TatA